MSDVVEGRSDERTSPSSPFSSSMVTHSFTRVRMNMVHSTSPDYNLAGLVRAMKLDNAPLHENQAPPVVQTPHYPRSKLPSISCTPTRRSTRLLISNTLLGYNIAQQ